MVGAIRRRLLRALGQGALVSLMLTLVLATSATAQDQTPRELPFTPDPELCEVEPRSIDELVMITGTPEAGTQRVEESDSGTPEGEAADEETVGAVTATIIEAIACVNGGEFLRFLSLVTDEGIVDLVGGEPLEAEVLEHFADIAGTPAAAEQEVTLIDVRDVRVDGDRVSAIVEASTGGEESQVDLFYLVEEDGRYLIDGVVEDIESPSGTPPA